MAGYGDLPRDQGLEVNVRRKELSIIGDHTRLSSNFSTSTSGKIRIPNGFGIVGLMWPNLSTRVNIRVQVAESVSGTYRTLRKSDGTGVFDPMNGTSTSVAAAIVVLDVAPFKFMRVALNKGTGQAYRWRFVCKG